MNLAPARKTLLAGVVLAASASLLTACSGQPTTADAVQPTGASSVSAPLTGAGTKQVGADKQKNFTVVVNVVNNSSYPMHWVKDAGDGIVPDSPPLTIPPNGGTDRIKFETNAAHGLQIKPTWRVGDTEYTVFPRFAVPTVGPNGFDCSIDNVDAGSPVGIGGCDIGAHYHPDAHLTFFDRH